MDAKRDAGFSYLVALEPGCNKDPPVVFCQCGSVEEAKHHLSVLIQKVVANSSQVDDYYIIPDHNDATSQSGAARWEQYISSGRLVPLNATKDSPYFFQSVKDEESYVRALQTTRYEHDIRKPNETKNETRPQAHVAQPTTMGPRILWTEETLWPELIPDFLSYAKEPFSAYIPYHFPFLTEKDYDCIVHGVTDGKSNEHQCGVSKFYIIRSDTKSPPLHKIPFFQM